MLAFRIIIEIVYQKTFSKRIADYTDSLDQRNIFKDLLEELKSQEVPSSKIVEQYPDLQWCLLNNSIYDLREFDHPGGNNIIEQINGFHKYILLKNIYLLN